MVKRISFLAIVFCFCQPALAQTKTMYDVVLVGGRVIDPETKLDAIKNVGIHNNRIAQISSEPLKGKEMKFIESFFILSATINGKVGYYLTTFKSESKGTYYWWR